MDKVNLTTEERWNAPTSKYFQPLQSIATWVAALSAGIAAIVHSLSTAEIPVPGFVDLILLVLGVVGSVVASLTKLTVDFEGVNWKAIQRARDEKERAELGYFK